MKPALYFITLSLLCACHPADRSAEKITVNVNGKKAAVVDHPAAPNGNTYVPEPCVTCLLQIIQHSKSYRSATQRLKPADLVYNVKRVSGPALTHRVEHPGGGMQVDISQKNKPANSHLLTYLYNNTTGTFYFLNKDNKYAEEPVNADKTALLKVRNSCFWGVASNR